MTTPLTPDQLARIGLPLVQKLAKLYSYKIKVSEDELFSFLLEKLAIIIQKFDSTKSNNFSAYVTRCCQCYSYNYLRDSARIIKIPRDYSVKYLQRNKLLKQTPGLNSLEVATELGLTRAELDEAVTAIGTSIVELTNYKDYLLYSPVDQDSTNEHQYIEKLSAEDRTLLELHFVQKFALEELSQAFGFTVAELQAKIDEHISNLNLIMETL